MQQVDSRWFTRFQVQAEDEAGDDIVWADVEMLPPAVRKPTETERLSILMIGIVAIGLLIAMVATLVIGVYVSRR